MPFVTERFFMEMDRYVSRQNMTDDQKLKWIQQSAGNQIPKIPKKELTAEERAEDLAFDILEGVESPDLEWEDVVEYEKMAKEAYSLCPESLYAIEANVQLSTNLDIRKRFLIKGIAVGNEKFGGKYEEENIGNFWGLNPTRPYIRLLVAYAQLLVDENKKKEAIEIYKRVLALNTNDNSGVRYLLQVLYLDVKEYDGFMDLLDQFEDDHSIQTLFNYALYSFMIEGENEETDHAMLDALEYNPYVLDYLLGKKVPKKPLTTYNPKGEDGAIVYCQEALHVWRKQVGIQLWLRTFL